MAHDAGTVVTGTAEPAAHGIFVHLDNTARAPKRVALGQRGRGDGEYVLFFPQTEVGSADPLGEVSVTHGTFQLRIPQNYLLANVSRKQPTR